MAVCVYQQYRIGKYIHNLCKNHTLVATRISQLMSARLSSRQSTFNLNDVFEDANANDPPVAPNVDEYKLTKIKELNSRFGSVENRLIKSIWNLLPYISIFYSLFLLDTIGDEVGATNALWAPIVLIISINIIYIRPFALHFYKHKIEMKRSSSNPGTTDVVTQEIQMESIYEKSSFKSRFDGRSVYIPSTSSAQNPLHRPYS